jgi:hypothetical protein
MGILTLNLLPLYKLHTKSNTVGILEFTIFVYKLLEFTIDSSYNSSSFQKKIVISVAASPLNMGMG